MSNPPPQSLGKRGRGGARRGGAQAGRPAQAGAGGPPRVKVEPIPVPEDSEVSSLRVGLQLTFRSRLPSLQLDSPT